jgi:hypothetical protein
MDTRMRVTGECKSNSQPGPFPFPLFVVILASQCPLGKRPPDACKQTCDSTVSSVESLISRLKSNLEEFIVTTIQGA